MPRNRPRRMARAIALVATASAFACTSFGLLAAPASAGLLSTVAGIVPSCAARPTTTPFTPWGDNSNYFLMPAGGFEVGTTGWTLAGGPKVVAGNESSFVNAKTDTHSLSMPTAASVVSPTVCVAMGENTVRMFVKNSGVAGSDLHIQAFVENPLTGLVLSTGFDIKGIAGNTSWAPTGRLLIPNLLGGVAGTQNLTLVFTTTGKPATWNVDDVFVDPFKSR
jgi:hypothetical protein